MHFGSEEGLQLNAKCSLSFSIRRFDQLLFVTTFLAKIAHLAYWPGLVRGMVGKKINSLELYNSPPIQTFLGKKLTH